MKTPKPLNIVLLAVWLTFGGIGAALAQEGLDRIEIEDAAGKVVAAIEKRADSIRIEYSEAGTERVLVGRSSGDGKRKWQTVDGSTEVEIKYDGANFKLRLPDGSLLWKVKHYPGEKIKISANEENEDPHEIRLYPGEPRLKLKYRDEEVAQVKWYADSGKLKLKRADGSEAYVRKAGSLGADLAAMLVDGASLRDRLILAAELWLAQATLLKP